MTIYANLGNCKVCQKHDFNALLLQKGFRIYTKKGQYWKLELETKSVFACDKAIGKTYDINNYQDWSEIKNILSNLK